MLRAIKDVSRVITFPGQGKLINAELLQHLKPLHRESRIPIPESLAKALFDNNTPREFFLKTSNLQPAIVYVSLLIWQQLEHQGMSFEPSHVMGHSLGELTTLVINGVIPRESAVHVAHCRGKFMEDCIKEDKYGMTAYLFKESSEAMTIIQDRVNRFPSLGIANINGHNQCVVSGQLDELAQLSSFLKKDIKAKGTKLDVKLPFHNELLNESKERFKELINTQFDIQGEKELLVPIVSNIDAQISRTHGEALGRFIEDFTKPVQFAKSLESLLEYEVEFINVGPNANVIQGLVRRMDKGTVKSNLTIESLEDIITMK
jgi:[acyl-carrier-protein] S-malonyltransferase